MSFNNRVLFAAAFIALAACGGGGSASAPGVPSAPAATPTPIATGGSALQSARLTLTFPVGSSSATASAHRKSSAARKPHFVDGSATTQLLTVINSIGGNTTLPAAVQPYASMTQQLTTTGGSPNCTVTAGVETCSVSVAAPAGSVSYTFTAEDANGTALSTATTTVTITKGVETDFSVVLEGIVTDGDVFNAPTGLTAGTPAAGSLDVVLLDPDGNVITGSAAFAGGAITVSSNSAHFTIALTQTGTYGSSVSVDSGAAAAGLYYKYDGVAVSNPAGFDVIIGSLNTVPLTTTNSNPTIAGLTNAGISNGSAPGAVNYGSPTLIFDASGQTSTAASASEVGFTPSTYGSGQLTIALASPQPTGAGSDNGNGTYDATNCGAVVTALSIGAPDATAAGNEIISATSGVAGICAVVVSDGLGDTTTFYISVTTASGSINARHRAAR